MRVIPRVHHHRPTIASSYRHQAMKNLEKKNADKNGREFEGNQQCTASAVRSREKKKSRARVNYDRYNVNEVEMNQGKEQECKLQE